MYHERPIATARFCDQNKVCTLSRLLKIQSILNLLFRWIISSIFENHFFQLGSQIIQNLENQLEEQKPWDGSPLIFSQIWKSQLLALKVGILDKLDLARKCDPMHYMGRDGLGSTPPGWPQPEKHLNNSSNRKLLLLKVNTISIYLKPWIISTTKKE